MHFSSTTIKYIKKIYKVLPLHPARKEKVKDFVYTYFGFMLRDTLMYRMWQVYKKNGGYPQDSQLAAGGTQVVYEFTQELDNSQPGKIGIHVHLYYIDLLDEFVRFLANMPFNYDLYISITDETHREPVSAKLRQLPYLQKFKIEKVTNRGRDVAPLLVTFAKELLQYDFICHIHTKKSLYSGKSQDSWRQHLLHNLFGSADIIKTIFTIFKRHKTVGLVYPETYNELPYWGHTWLSSKSVGTKFLASLGIALDGAAYIDYPAGTMFWAKAKAIQPLLALGLSYQDFAEEAKQTDGTLAHAVERSLVPVVRQQGMTLCEINCENNLYRIGTGSKNLWQYWLKTKNDIATMPDTDIVSFDIFDTLVTRPLLDPDAAFLLVEHKIRQQLNMTIEYVQNRKLAEGEVRSKQEFKGDCSIDEIYQEFARLTKLPQETCETIKQMEIQNEINICIPRKDMVDIFYQLKANGKKIWLVSDMYLCKNHIEAILDKCGISGYDELLISSNLGKRKDTGEMWTHVQKCTAGKQCLHIGDNEHSDIQMPTDRDIANYHVMSSANLFYQTSLGTVIHKHRRSLQWGDSALFGTIVAQKFNSPYTLNQTNGKFQITDFHSLGYVIFGPVMLYFIVWLLRYIKEDNISKVLFLAREGYLLEELFKMVYHCSGVAKGNLPVDTMYFLTSRRASSVAAIAEEADIDALLSTTYKGTVANLLVARFGIQVGDDTDELKQVIALPQDYKMVKAILSDYQDTILENAKTERENYSGYLVENGVVSADHIAVVDLGYSGTIQYYISKLLKSSTTGYYFVTSNDQKANNYRGNVMKGCFGEGEEYLTTSKPVYKYHLVLESILTSPDGQFIGFGRNGDILQPQFGKPGYSQQIFDQISQVHQGIRDYFKDVLDQYADYVLDMPVTEEIIQEYFAMIFQDETLLAEDIKKAFFVEDNYCSSEEITVFDFYRQLWRQS